MDFDTSKFSEFWTYFCVPFQVKVAGPLDVERDPSASALLHRHCGAGRGGAGPNNGPNGPNNDGATSEMQLLAVLIFFDLR